MKSEYKAKPLVVIEPVLAPVQPDITLQAELEALKASLKRIESRIEDLVLYATRPYRQW